MAREIDKLLIVRFLVTIEVALDFYINVLCAEAIDGVFICAVEHADEAAGKLQELLRRGRAFTLGGTQLHARNQAAQVLITLAAFGQQRIAMAVGAGDLGADVGLNAELLGGLVKARSSAEA